MRIQSKISTLKNEADVAVKNRLEKDELRQLKDLSRFLSFDPYKNRKQAVAARITEIDNSNPYIVFTVDAGTEDGVSKDDIVVDGKGLIGKVLDTGKHWSKVVSVLSETNNISFKSLRKTSVMGVLAGDGKKILKGYGAEIGRASCRERV